MPLLPPNGAEIPCSSLAINTPVQIGTAKVTVDFRGGIKHRVEANPNDPTNSRRLQLVGFKSTAQIPSDAGGGTLTFEQSDVDVDPKGLLRLTQTTPPLECSMGLRTCTLTIDRPGEEPLVLSPKGEAMLVGKVSQFPPRGDLFQLQAPVEFVDPEKPDDIAAVLQKFPAKIGGL